MRTLSVFDNVSLDGYFTDRHGDMSWAHKQDPEWREFTNENASGDSELVFGRVTYQMMASFWPTPMAAQAMPQVARKMNAAPKVVFSHSLEEATWANTRLVKGDLVAEVVRLKREPGPPMVLMGSGSIVAQLSRAQLIDSYQLVVHPLALGAGRTLFDGVEPPLALRLEKTRAFGNGCVVCWYQLAAR